LSSTQAQQASQIADLNIQSADLSQQASEDIKQAGNLQAQSQLVELQGQLATQQKRVQAANALGTNVGDVTDIITQIGQEMRTTAVALTNAQARVADIESNSDLLSNPIGWLNDLVNGDGARAERDAQAQKFDTLQKTAAGLNATTQSTAQTQNAITETLTQASIQNTAEATKLLAQAEASKQAIAGKQYGAQAVEALRQNGAQEFNRQVQVYSQITDEARYQEGAALRREQFAALQEQRKKGKLEDQEYTDATARVNEYRTKAGLPPVNETFVRRTLTQGGELGDDIRRQEASGMRLMGGEMSVFGNSPAQTISVIQKDTPKLPDSYKPAVTILQEGATNASAVIQKEALNPTSDIKKNTAAQAKIVNESVKATALNYQSNIQTGKGNPYEAPPVSVVLAEPNGLKDTKFGQTVLQTLVSTGQNNPTPDIVIAAGVSAFQAGELSLSEARDGIAAFYQNAVGINNATGGFLQLGVPPQQGYRTSVQSFKRGFFDSLGSSLEIASGGLNARAEAANRQQSIKAARPLDLTKSTDVTLALTVMQSKKMAESILQRTPK
jgi:hypothetical protein